MACPLAVGILGLSPANRDQFCPRGIYVGARALVCPYNRPVPGGAHSRRSLGSPADYPDLGKPAWYNNSISSATPPVGLWRKAASGFHVRREKAALSSGCKPHPAIRSSRKQSEQSWR